MGKEKGQTTGEKVLMNLGELKEKKKTACRDCVGLFWQSLFTEIGSFPAGREARCKKSENKKTKEYVFNPVSGEEILQEYYPGGFDNYFVGEKYKLCEEVNTGNCSKFEEATEECVED